MKYFDELKKSMEWLGEKSDTFFIGQAVEVPGTAMFNTLKDVESDKRLEVPVFEDTQMGMSIGMALTGQRIISIFPRWNFLLLATNQLVNHLDKFEIMSQGQLKTKVIIRTSIGSQRPLHPQHQHIGDFTFEIRKMCKNIDVIRLDNPNKIFSAYKKAFSKKVKKCTIIVEYGDYYNEK